MTDLVLPKPPKQARAAVREGRSGHPAAAARAPATKRHLPLRHCWKGKSEALTRRAVELALAGDPTALRLCIERILPPCRERTIKFELPPIKSAADIAPAMDAVTSALAGG